MSDSRNVDKGFERGMTSHIPRTRNRKYVATSMDCYGGTKEMLKGPNHNVIPIPEMQSGYNTALSSKKYTHRDKPSHVISKFDSLTTK